MEARVCKRKMVKPRRRQEFAAVVRSISAPPLLFVDSFSLGLANSSNHFANRPVALRYRVQLCPCLVLSVPFGADDRSWPCD